MSVSYWLVKTEPDVFSYDDLERLGSTDWDGVRNYQARNHLRAMRLGDLVIVYHSNANPPGVAGVAEVGAEHTPDPSQFNPGSPYFDAASRREDPRWSMVRIVPRGRLRLVALETLRDSPALAGSRLLAKGNRLSVLPLSKAEFEAIRELGAG